MPYRRRTTTKRVIRKTQRTVRRTYRKRTRGARGAPMTRSLGIIVPEKSIATLKYSDTFSNSGTVNSWYSWTFAANSLYDPDATGGGHQPMGFDQLSLMYNRYSVLSSWIIVHVSNLQGSQNVYGILIRESTASGYSFYINDIAEQNPRDRIKTIAPQRPATFKKNWSCKLISDKGDNTGICGNLGTGSSPNILHYFRMHTQSTTGASLAAQPQFAVEVYFKAMFSDRKLLAPS